MKRETKQNLPPSIVWRRRTRRVSRGMATLPLVALCAALVAALFYALFRLGLAVANIAKGASGLSDWLWVALAAIVALYFLGRSREDPPPPSKLSTAIYRKS